MMQKKSQDGELQIVWNLNRIKLNTRLDTIYVQLRYCYNDGSQACSLPLVRYVCSMQFFVTSTSGELQWLTNCHIQYAKHENEHQHQHVFIEFSKDQYMRVVDDTVDTHYNLFK